jgi:hypothetical protein
MGLVNLTTHQNGIESSKSLKLFSTPDTAGLVENFVGALPAAVVAAV